MHNIIKGVLFALVFVFAAPVAGQDFDTGDEAYQRGDYAAALHEWLPLAEQGHAQAQYHLGIMYLIGNGVSQNHAEAAKWYHKAAEQEVAFAQYMLGFMYARGLGVAQDIVQAHMWSNLAASRGNDDAAHGRDKMARKMTPEQLAEAEKLAREWKPK